MKEIKRGEFKACCPAHDDNTPSLSIKETEDGTLLLKCWAGCEVLEIVHAVGLELSDLFPQRYESRAKPRNQRRMGTKDALDAAAFELTVVGVIASDLKEKKDCGEEIFARLTLASSRLRAAREAL